MMFLLDVNALLALGHHEHEFHSQVMRWISQGPCELATCSITELGFVRVLSNVRPYGTSVPEAQSLLLRVKASHKFTFIADSLDVSSLPAWVKSADQTTDGHLVELAKLNSGVLATLDRKIPGAFAIPGV